MRGNKALIATAYLQDLYSLECNRARKLLVVAVLLNSIITIFTNLNHQHLLHHHIIKSINVSVFIDRAI